MKELSELKFPDDLRYSEDHEWVVCEGDRARVGITDYAQDQLGDIVFVELPEVGSTFAKGISFGVVESVKAVSELYMPVGGEVVAVNTALEDAPEAVNSSPYDDGWMIEIHPSEPADFETLRARDAYVEMLEGAE